MYVTNIFIRVYRLIILGQEKTKTVCQERQWDNVLFGALKVPYSKKLKIKLEM